MTIALYNEIDPFAADTLENLIDAGLIAPGIVDRRSIEDLTPEYLAHFTQVHFFAGIGVWSHALRQAGVSDDTSLWTGSCPCQPFSSAGKGDGFDDERHLWPAWFWLIEQCRPERLFGEQVASKDANPWVALVQADLEGLGYSFGAVPFTAAGIGAPNIRERLYWLADSEGVGRCQERQDGRGGPLGDRTEGRSTGHATGGSNVRVGDTASQRLEGCVGAGDEKSTGGGGLLPGRTVPDTSDMARTFWSGCEWVLCRDPSGPRWRPVEPGTFPLAHGLARGMGSLDARLSELAGVADLDAASLRDAKSYRVGALKAYGNAINAVAATEFIRACT